MIKRIQICIVVLFSLIPLFTFATHVVGGSLTYVYNGGSNYTITLKLYRDCGPGTASLPGSVTIQIKDVNGNAFSPSKNVTINLTSVTNIAGSLDPCAIPPNPSPCVEEAVYTTTVNNLPPNATGYHLYYQICCRNASILNIVNPGAAGETFYANIPGSSFVPNSDPVFNLFPPLFICVNKPFTFNHSATDADGDSLVYSLYQPYNNNAPTFPGGVATFPTVTYVGGYSTTSPLGAGPFSINSSTGLLNGTPNTLGQFVVGVKVKEYRNGVYIGETIRDFQFNVVNCPQPPPSLAVPNATINNGCSAKPIATGITSVSATWNSISPGTPGAYNNYLACTSGCLNNTITPVGSPPPFVDFVVCGISTSCSGAAICDTFRVFFNPSLAVNIQPSNPTLCFGQTSTTITAIGSGGTPPYSYLWNNVNPSQTINVGVGTYNVQLSDASGCPPVYSAVSVTAFTAPITANAGPDKTVCNQNPITTFNGTVTGASGGIWSGGSGTFTPNNTTLSNVSYSPTPTELATGFVNLLLTTTGNGTCPSQTDTLKITYVGFTGTVTPTFTNASCFGGSNGAANVSLTGGFTPYTYSWNSVPSQTTANATNLPIGIYTVSITDGIGCVTQKTVTISQPPILAINSTIKNVSCYGGSTGSISITPTGGTSPYTYTWSPGGQTTFSITNLPIGNYSVNVTDSKGCVTSSSYTVIQPPSISVNYSLTNVTCFNLNNGTYNTSVSGGTPPYTYSWVPGGSTASSATGLAAGNYTLIVRDNLNCTRNNTLSITQPSSLTAVKSVTNETCNYLNNGAASITASGGTPNYTYSWTPGGQTTSSITNQASGTYTAKVTDSKGCITTTLITITEPSPLVVNFINATNVNCFGDNSGSVSASPSGGTPNYTYQWSPGGVTTSALNNITAGTYSVTVTDNKLCTATNTVLITQPTNITVTNTITNTTCNGLLNGSIVLNTSGGVSPYTYNWLPNGQTTSSITSVGAGTYTVTVTDFNGCLKTNTYTVSQPLPLSTTLTPTNVSCFGGNNGAISSSVSGGTAPYTYSWSPGGVTTPNLSGLTANTYTLKVKDNNNCSQTSTVAITQPTVLAIVSSFTNETCDYLNNGIATVTVSGGTTPYNYLWSPGGYTTATATNLSAGSYTVLITDNNGCVKTKTVTISQPNPININFINQINVSCFGGNNGYIATSVSGGSPNYTYTWSPNNAHTTSLMNIAAGTYTLNITDTKSCTAQNTVTITQPSLALNATVLSQSATCYGTATGSITVNGIGGTPSYNYTWTPGSIVGNSLTNVSAGTYSVKVVDSKGCITTKTVSVTQPTQIVATVTTTNSTCGNPNGVGSVSVTGGLPPYTYQWNPTGGTNPLSTGLLAGPYTVIITDVNGCQGSKSFNVNDNGGPVASIFSTTNVSCFGGNNGSATAGVVGGLPPITYSWSPSGGTSATATGLTAGIYYVTVTDANGCISLATTSPEITEPSAISSVITTSNVSCFGGSNGSATVTASGGNPSYTYTWLPSSTTGNTITGQSANTYSVQIKDQNNCVLTSTYTISQPTASISITATTTSVSCFGGNNGSADALASGGTGPYFYNWMPGNFFGHAVSNLTSNTYSVNVTDANGCTLTNTIMVVEATNIVLNTGSINSNCSLANGQVSVSAAGGTGTYTYSWSPSGGTNPIESNLLTGNYTVEVTDANGCSAVASQTLIDNPSPTVSISQTSSVSCFGGSNGALATTVTGGTGPFTYTWSPTGGNNSTATGLSSNAYTVNITAANGCTATAVSSVIPQPSQLFSIISTSNVSCFAGNDGKASITAGGGVSPYSFLWLPSASSGSIITTQSAGNYSVQITDANNCILTSTYSITQPTSALSAAATSTAVLCNGGNTGLASANAIGGTSPYNYNWLPMSVNSSTIGGLSLGIYTVNVTDIKGCTTTTTVSVTEPTLALSATGNGAPTSCFGGSNGTATITATGGTGSYNYLWSPSGGTNSTASSLSPGNYFVTVSDANNCQTNVSVIISAPTAVSGSLTVLNPACNQSNGFISAQVTGGISPYTYTWSPSASINTSTIGGLLPGTYTLQVEDFNNCIKTLTTSLVNISGPTLSLLTTTNNTCFGGNNGAATFSISSGTAPYTTSWAPFGGNSTTATQLTAGIYTANVTDSRGCLSSITATISEPSPISINVSSITNVSCFGGNNGAITVSASGGTAGYTYNWLPSGTGATNSNLIAGTYTVNVLDANSCPAVITANVSQPTAALTSTITNVVNLLCYYSSGSASAIVSGGTAPYTYTWTSTPLQNGSTAINLLSGTYTVAISDAKGCVTNNSITLTQPTQIYSSAGINDTICIGQQATLTASATGGAGNYYYVWQPVNTTNAGSLLISPTNNTSYTVVAFDQNGCAGLPDVAEVVVFNLTAPNIQTFGLTPICPGQSTLLSALVTGNTGPITYSWSNGLGTGSGPIIVIPSQPTTYYVTISNNCGTSILDSVVVAFNPPPSVVSAFNGTLACAPGILNFIDNSVTGNINDPITSWLWDFGDGSSSVVQNPSHNYNAAGTYSITLTVTTDGGCTNNNNSAPIVVTAYPYPVAQFSVNTTTFNLPYDILHCTNQSTGAVTYSWNFGDGNISSLTNPNHNYTTVGNYEIVLVAISNHGCTDTAKIDIVTDADVVFPNAFTPSPDGPSGGYYVPGSLDNDIFFPYTSGVVEYKFQIFDRWGELIFETEDIKQGWDGYYRDKICQLGVYVWKAYVKLNNGKEFKKTGDVTLLR